MCRQVRRLKLRQHVQSGSEIAAIIQVLTNTLDVICAEEIDNSYEVKQKLVNKISELLDKI